MYRRPPESTRTDTPFPYRRSSDHAADPLDQAPESEIARAVVRPLWSDLQERFMGELEQITIEDLCCRAQDAGIDSQSAGRSEEHTSELQSLMRISYAAFCLKTKTYYDTI